MYHAGAMVASRKPRTKSTHRPSETLAEKFARVMAEPVGAPFPKLTKREARYFLRRLYETGDRGAPTGDAVMRAFYGECLCCADGDDHSG